MAVDKSLMEAPQGIAAIAVEVEPVEIEIEIASEEDDAVIGAVEDEPRSKDFDDNLAEYIGENELQSLSMELLGTSTPDTNVPRVANAGVAPDPGCHR